MAAGSFASKQKVERLEQEVSNLRSAMERQTALFLELREQVAPTDPYNSFMVNTTAGSNPVLKNGTVISHG